MLRTVGLILSPPRLPLFPPGALLAPLSLSGRSLGGGGARRSLGEGGFLLRADCAARRTTRSFVAPHFLEHVLQPEIDLPALHVDADDLHADLVTEAIGLLRALAKQRVLLLAEPVVIVGHRADMDETFDVMLGQLDEHAERRHTGDVAVKHVADLVGHETHLLPLQDLTYGVGSPVLPLGSVPSS